jgi:hypothetical protein
MVYNVWRLGSSHLSMYLCYSDMFYIQWHRSAKKDVLNKIHMNKNINMKYNMD